MLKDKKQISVVTGLYVENEKNEILFIRMPQYGNKWGVPGGHVELGETLQQSAMRELKEETGLDASNVEYLGYIENINPEDYHTQKHFIGFCFRVSVIGQPSITPDEREVSEYRWMTLEEALKQEDLNLMTRQAIETVLIKKDSCSSCDQYKQGWQRAQADYQNLMREMDSKKSELVAWSKQMILEDFLPVYDNFKKAFSAGRGTSDEERENWAKGIEYIMKQYGKVLTDHGIVEMKTVGEMFDPRRHEAMQEEESEQPEGTIIRELDAGYMMGEKVVKVAKVVVAKAKN